MDGIVKSEEGMEIVISNVPQFVWDFKAYIDNGGTMKFSEWFAQYQQ